jgi:hypothetical protein
MNNRQDKTREENENKEKKQTPEQKTGMYPPDAKEAASNGIQESAFGSRSYAWPDFFKKKPKL